MLAAFVIPLSLLSLIISNLWVAVSARGRFDDRIEAVPSHTIAIVPGADVSRGSPLSSLRARLEAALAVYQRGRVHAILVSGLNTAASPEVTVMRSWLEERGVPSDAIWTDSGGVRTRDTMLRAAALYDVHDAVVCTQTVNMPRALYLARAAGIEATGLGIPSTLEHSARYRAIEALKTSLAFAESLWGSGAPTLASERVRRDTVAVR